MRFEVILEGFDVAMAKMANRGKQVKFAAAVALTRTAADIKEAVPSALDLVLDRPTTFTRFGTFVSRATRDNLEATVGFKDRQAAYMKYQISGGSRMPGAGGLKLPGAIQLNEFGNIPRGLIAKMIAAARKQGQLTKRVAKRIKVSAKVDLFYGDPKDQGGHRWPRGIYKDVDLGGGRRRLIPLIVFPLVAARYKKRFDFAGLAKSIVDRKWDANFKAAFDEAIRTAR